jgi:hypothetical protein
MDSKNFERAQEQYPILYILFPYFSIYYLLFYFVYNTKLLGSYDLLKVFYILTPVSFFSKLA